MEATGEKKPAEISGRGAAVQLLDVEMVVIARYGSGYGISTLGARYSAPPTCAQAMCADLAWIHALDAQTLGLANSVDADEGGLECAAHLRALLDALGSSTFLESTMPQTFLVPGLGAWNFRPLD